MSCSDQVHCTLTALRKPPPISSLLKNSILAQRPSCDQEDMLLFSILGELSSKRYTVTGSPARWMDTFWGQIMTLLKWESRLNISRYLLLRLNRNRKWIGRSCHFIKEVKGNKCSEIKNLLISLNSYVLMISIFEITNIFKKNFKKATVPQTCDVNLFMLSLLDNGLRPFLN